VVNVCTAIATGVQRRRPARDPRIDVFTAEDGAAWTSSCAAWLPRGLASVRLVISDDHLGLKQAIAAVLPGAAGSVAEFTSSANLLSECPSRRRR